MARMIVVEDFDFIAGNLKIHCLYDDHWQIAGPMVRAWKRGTIRLAINALCSRQK